MKITFLPMRRDDSLTLCRDADTLIVNGASHDFSSIREEEELAADDLDCEWISGAVGRVGGVLQIAVVLPHGPDAPHEALYPVPILAVDDGPIALPGDA